MFLSPAIDLVPYLHGLLAFARHVRSLCLKRRYDCIAVDLPACFEEALPPAVDDLPYISAVVAQDGAEPLYYIPTDPCDAAIEAVRQARQNRAVCALIGYPGLTPPRPLPPLPDSHAMTDLGFDAFAALCVSAVGKRPLSEEEERAARYQAFRLHGLRQSHQAILALVHVRTFSRVPHHFGREATHNLAFPPASGYRFDTHYVNPDHLYFALGELPFVAGRVEHARHDPLAADPCAVDMVKDLFVDTRDEYAEEREEVLALPASRIQAGLTFLRNLTVMDSRLMPGLFDIVAAAKGVGGNSYGLRILRNAKYYPYLPLESQADFVSVGVERISLPPLRQPAPAVNLLRDVALVWSTLSIKPDPSARKKRHYRFRWNPLGMCSHVPEDRRIESFNVHVRRKAMRALCEDMVKTEKFSTSLKDGLDIRETLRNWHQGGIYVKELPPSRGEMDSVVIIFDAAHDERYTHCAAWYAEHEEESTLTFYATEPMEDLVGPGIARCRYGGLSLLFPPRHVPNIFAITRAEDFRDLAQQLTYGALLFSKEKNVACVAAQKPDLATVAMAGRLRKHLVWIPLGSFSTETLRRLQRFHVLNGKTVRSWATRFIGD